MLCEDSTLRVRHLHISLLEQILHNLGYSKNKVCRGGDRWNWVVFCVGRTEKWSQEGNPSIFICLLPEVRFFWKDCMQAEHSKHNSRRISVRNKLQSRTPVKNSSQESAEFYLQCRFTSLEMSFHRAMEKGCRTNKHPSPSQIESK